VTVRADAPLVQAVELLLTHGISGLPVQDGAGRLVGMLTEGDLLRRAETGTARARPRWIEFLLGPGRLAFDYVHSHGRLVREVMTPDVITVGPHTPLAEVVRLFERRHIKRVPVVDAGAMVGLVSRSDLLPVLLAAMPTLPPATPDDAAIGAQLWAAIEAAPWGPPATVNVFVRHGEVTLRGTVADPRQAQALQVAAENIAGVREVHNELLWCEPVTGIAGAPVL
jgi:CBS domain-containing protein